LRRVDYPNVAVKRISSPSGNAGFVTYKVQRLAPGGSGPIPFPVVNSIHNKYLRLPFHMVSRVHYALTEPGV